MIEFVTLLLGLVTGPQAVQLVASSEVALVELRLDGRFAGSVSQAPWIVGCEFGDQLSPHELTATAYDSQRRVLHTIRQWVNRPRRRLEARLSLDRAPGSPATARLIWSALDHREAPEVSLTFDGQPLAAPDLEAIEIPPHDPASVHLLRAELGFSAVEQEHAELVFGGTYREDVATELTALVLSAREGPERPEAMEGWFEHRGQSVRVEAVDRGPVNLVVVRERSAATLDGLRTVYQTLRRRRAHRLQTPPSTPVLGPRDRVRFAFPTTGREPTKIGLGEIPLAVEQVPVSRDAGRERPLIELLTDSFYPDQDTPAPRSQLADAVAVAGLAAANGDRRRAVLVIRSGQSLDDSHFSVAEVREYLRRLGVPLVVWTIPVAGEVTSSEWGPAPDVSHQQGFLRALDELRDRLESQVVVWVDGSLLPHQVALTSHARGLRWAHSGDR